jgi:hypothetical protein
MYNGVETTKNNIISIEKHGKKGVTMYIHAVAFFKTSYKKVAYAFPATKLENEPLVPEWNVDTTELKRVRLMNVEKICNNNSLQYNYIYFNNRFTKSDGPLVEKPDFSAKITQLHEEDLKEIGAPEVASVVPVTRKRTSGPVAADYEDSEFQEKLPRRTTPTRLKPEPKAPKQLTLEERVMQDTKEIESLTKELDPENLANQLKLGVCVEFAQKLSVLYKLIKQGLDNSVKQFQSLE